MLDNAVYGTFQGISAGSEQLSAPPPAVYQSLWML